MQFLSLSLAALLASVLAQESTTTDSSSAIAITVTATESLTTDSGSTTGTSSQAFTTTIAVGRAGNTFEPNVVQVPVGGYVEFQFYPTNHSVIRAEYLYPCVPYELTGIGKVGFYSGGQPVDAILANPPTWPLQINDSDPIFFYCGAPNSCIGYQMVGVINPNASVSLDVQKEFAANSSFMLEPGQPWPDESDPFATTSTSTYTAVQTPTATSTQSATPASTSTAATSPDSSVSHKTTLSSGAIAGIAIGGAALVLAAAVLFFFCGRKSKRRADNHPNDTHTPANPPSYAPLSNNYGYMSPVNKRISMTSMPTDAFGNPIQNGGMYGYPVTYQQGYQPPQMQQNPVANFTQPQPSPSNEIFGPVAPSLQHMHDTQPGTEDHSLRASSPSSMHVTSTAPVSGGIEAFLQRQGRMSPQPENEGPGSVVPPHMRTGPYEMSASGTHQRT